MKNLFYYPYPPGFDNDIKLISEHGEIDHSESLSIYQQLRKKHGELEWLTLNHKQKIKRIKDHFNLPSS